MNNSIAKNATILTVTKIINLAIGMANAMILSRFRTLEEYGTYSQLNIAVALFTTIMMLGLPGSINYFLSKAESGKEKSIFLSNYYTISTILSIATGILLLVGMPLIVKYFKNELIYSFSFYLLLMPWINIIGGSIGNLLIVIERVRLLSLYNIITSILLLGILLTSSILNLNFMQYMYGYVATQIVITLFIYFTANRLVGGIYPSINYLLLKKILKFSIPLGLATIVGTISIELDKLMIGYFYDTEMMAIYTNASREIPVTIISSSITAVLMPHLVRMLHENKKDDAVLLWKDATSFSYTFICFFATALFVFAPEVITLLYSAKYLPGVPVFRIYNIVLLLRCTYFGMILNSLGKTKFIFYSSVASLVLNVALNYIFYLMFGLIGPAIATLVSIFAVGFYQLIATSSNLKIAFTKIFPWKNYFKITIINILLGVSVYYIKFDFHVEQITGEIIESIIFGFFWAVIYGIIMSKSIQKFWMSLR